MPFGIALCPVSGHGLVPKVKGMDAFFIDQRPPLYRRLRANLQEAAPEDGRRHSKLASTLLEQWAWGEIAAPLLQQLASAAVADGALHPQLTSLSKLGHNGQFPGNCHKDQERCVALHIAGDKVDTELPRMPLHRVWSFMFDQRAMRRDKRRQRRMR